MPALNAKKSATKKAAVRKTAGKKATVKKATGKKSAGKKAAATKTSATKSATTKSTKSTKSTKPTKSTKTAVSTGAPARKPAPASPAQAGTSLVAIGAQAPDFTLPDGAGTPVTLSALRGGPVVLYFYPKDDTSGCTAEACDFRDNLAAFRKLGCTVLGVSPDSVASHAKFAAKHALGKLTLLSDAPDASGTPAVCAAYGVWQQKSMYGRAYMGVVRTTYVIAADGTVAARFDKVSVTDHASEVLTALRGL